jgi:hypothetical protein
MLAHEPLADPIRIETFKAEVRSWTDRIGLEDVPIQVRPMTHGWVTCSSRGRLSFDAQLLSQPQAFRGEVILFALLELLQRRAPPHGALFHTLPQSHEERR